VQPGTEKMHYYVNSSNPYVHVTKFRFFLFIYKVTNPSAMGTILVFPMEGVFLERKTRYSLIVAYPN
jgi:hypothetical protein